MGKLYFVDGVPHRIRRGKFVPIPEEWLGKTCHATHRRKRDAFARRIGGVKDAQGTGETAARRHIEVRGEDKAKQPVNERERHWKGAHRPYNRDGRAQQIRKQTAEQEEE